MPMKFQWFVRFVIIFILCIEKLQFSVANYSVMVDSLDDFVLFCSCTDCLGHLEMVPLKRTTSISQPISKVEFPQL